MVSKGAIDDVRIAFDQKNACSVGVISGVTLEIAVVDLDVVLWHH
jgi:hypothetical protein